MKDVVEPVATAPLKKMKTTPEMRARLRELSSPALDADDYDRAVRAMLDDLDRGVLITGVHLNAFHGRVWVELEIDGRWVRVITECGDVISHIVEPRGIRNCVSTSSSDATRSGS